VHDRKLLQKINLAARDIDKIMPIMLQVNISRDSNKSGFLAEDVPVIVKGMTEFSHLNLIGLMTITELYESSEAARGDFRAMRVLGDSVFGADSNYALSMGMSQDFEVAIEEGATHIIIDLRDNGGGYLESAVSIADEFLKSKELIVKTKNKKDKIESTLATEKGLFETGKVSVLINENSASASEILAGAIQDNDRGLIYGRRSFGKGLVQREMPLGDGSAVRLTVARYYTPSGRSIQKPYEDKGEIYFNEFDKRFESGELYEKDKATIALNVQDVFNSRKRMFNNNIPNILNSYVEEIFSKA
jgi:hypothetical protein